MPRFHFEDFVPGTSRLLGPKILTKEDIVAFAREFDPQPMHMDEEAAKKGFFGSLVASGWHLCAVFMRLCCDEFILDSSSMGSPGIDEVRWQKPAMPGDVLSLRLDILDARVASKRPELGLLQVAGELLNQRGEAVMTIRYWAMMGRRDAGAPVPPRRERAEAAPPRPAEILLGGHSRLAAPYLEDLPLGQVTDLGSVTFTADDIKRFARAYDPQPFHLDVEAAKASHFGGLCASGWHTASAFMRQILVTQGELRRKAAAAGEPIAGLGPSPGFTDMKWLRPVYAGDVIAFRLEVVEKRAMKSRPKWGIVFTHNTGTNQHGELVFQYHGSVLWERKGAK